MKSLLYLILLLSGPVFSFAQPKPTKADTLNFQKPEPRREISYKKIPPEPVILYTLHPPENRLVAFHQKHSTQIIKTNVAGMSATVLNYDSEIFDEGNRFNDGVFTVPYDGVYHFDISISFDYNLTDWEHNWIFELFLSSSPSHAMLEKSFMSFPAAQLGPFFTLSINTTRSLKKGEYIYASFRGTTSDGTAVAIQIIEGSFSGSKIAKF